ncbi:hypothetical protein JCM6882_004567 [Rhodosporidiobolus microsporus]
MPLFSFLPSPATFLKALATTLALALTGSGTALYLLQTRLIYPSNLPSGSRENVPTPDEFGIEQPWEDVELKAPDGVRVRAYVIKYARGGTEPRSRPTVLMLHANAGNVGHRLPIAKVFWSKMRCNVVALSYRGYGKSEGSPSEKGIKLDSQTALDYILSQPELEKTDIFLYGQSIGGAVAIHLASQNARSGRVKGLVIENTFMSLPDLIPHLLPLLRPFLPFLLTQIWPSKSSIASLPSDFPVLFLAGVRDELVEPGQMKGLWELCSSERKEWKEFEFGTHNDTCIQPHYFTQIARFIASVSDLPLPDLFAAPASASQPFPTTARPSTEPMSTAPAPTAAKIKELDAEKDDSAAAPASPTKSEASLSLSASSGSGASSFELVEPESGAEVETEGEKLEDEGGISAGGMGPREEVGEVKREAEGWVKSEL